MRILPDSDIFTRGASRGIHFERRTGSEGALRRHVTHDFQNALTCKTAQPDVNLTHLRVGAGAKWPYLRIPAIEVFRNIIQRRAAIRVYRTNIHRTLAMFHDIPCFWQRNRVATDRGTVKQRPAKIAGSSVKIRAMLRQILERTQIRTFPGTVQKRCPALRVGGVDFSAAPLDEITYHIQIAVRGGLGEGNHPRAVGCVGRKAANLDEIPKNLRVIRRPKRERTPFHHLKWVAIFILDEVLNLYEIPTPHSTCQRREPVA